MNTHTFIQIINFFIKEQNITNCFNPLYCYNNELKNKICGEIGTSIVATNKFIILKKILNGIFISKEQQEYLLDIFCKIQKIYRAFSLLAFMYKFKKAKIVISTDLNMNEIKPNPNTVIIVYQNELKYYFTIRDLINIIKTNLSHSDSFMFFSNPHVIKNPYINIPFTETNMYNIYFSIKSSNYIMPELLHGFFMSNFNLKKFNYQYENNIRNISIENYVYNSHHDNLYHHAQNMIYSFAPRKMCKNIHDDIPKEKLVDIMRPYLHLYFLGKYAASDTFIYLTSHYILKKKLFLFHLYNPLFGRKFIKKIIGQTKKREITFNLECINFYIEN
jgi:hypothetical protein